MCCIWFKLHVYLYFGSFVTIVPKERCGGRLLGLTGVVEDMAYTAMTGEWSWAHELCIFSKVLIVFNRAFTRDPTPYKERTDIVFIINVF